MEDAALLCPQCNQSTDVVHGTPAAFCPHCRLPLRRIAGKYQITRLLGEGGFGFVYLAHHTGLRHKPERVIKVMRPEIFLQPGMKARFAREIQLTATLSSQNPHIVQIHDDFGEEDGFGAYYVMEYLRGQTLFELFQAKPQLPQEMAFHIFRQICDGMAAAHAQGIAHRDLKPENIFLVTREEDPYFVKILDFGIAKIFEDENATRLTKGAVGTPAYMAPEQCLNQKVDHRADIYALGILLYQMLSGSFPFPEQIDKALPTVLFVVQSHLIVPARPLREAFPSLQIADGMDRAILRALEKKPDDRYSSVEAFWSEIFRQMTQQSTQIHWRPTPVPGPPALAALPLPSGPPSSLPSSFVPPLDPHTFAKEHPDPSLLSAVSDDPSSPSSPLLRLEPSLFPPGYVAPLPSALSTSPKHLPTPASPSPSNSSEHSSLPPLFPEDDPFASLGPDGLPDTLKTEEVSRPPDLTDLSDDPQIAFGHSLSLHTPPPTPAKKSPDADAKKPETSAFKRPSPLAAPPPSWSLDLENPLLSSKQPLPSPLLSSSASSPASSPLVSPPPSPISPSPKAPKSDPASFVEPSQLQDFFSSPKNPKKDRETRSVIRERPLFEKSYSSSDALEPFSAEPSEPNDDMSRTIPGSPAPQLEPPLEASNPLKAPNPPHVSKDRSDPKEQKAPVPPLSSASPPAPAKAPFRGTPSSPALIPMTPSKAKPIPAAMIAPNEPLDSSTPPPAIQAREMKLDAILDAFQKRQASLASDHPADPLFPSSPVRAQRDAPKPSFFQRLGRGLFALFKLLFLLVLGFSLGYLLLFFFN